MLLFGWLANISILVILFIFSHGTYFLNVVCITCICNLYFNYGFNIYALLLFYPCKLYCSAFFHSCIMSDIFVVSITLLWCFDLDLFHIQPSIDKCWIYGTYMCVYVHVYVSRCVLHEVCTVGKETVEHWAYSAALHHQMVALL